MIEQYPDLLIREDGTEWPCRFYPNTRSNGITKVKDGAEVNAKFTIALPVGSPILFIGEVISGMDKSGEHIVYQESIATFHRGQLHCVAYV